jgi:hypothetical protein
MAIAPGFRRNANATLRRQRVQSLINAGRPAASKSADAPEAAKA